MKFLYLGIVTVCTFLIAVYSFGVLMPCKVPIRYGIGTIDSQFGVSKEEVRQAAADAVSVWSSVSNRTLFLYDETASLKINLIFDERHQRFQTKEMWRAELSRLELVFKSAENILKQTETTYNKEIATLEQLKDEYANIVAELQVYEESEGVSLRSQRRLFSEMQRLERVIAQKVDDINVIVRTMNDLAEQINRGVELYNDEARRFNLQFGNGEAFTQGVFSRDTINIYTFKNKNELVWVLAHELGHALGLGHIEDEKSVMYYMLGDREVAPTLTESDKREFVRVCHSDNSMQAQFSFISTPFIQFINDVINIF
jgi:predicted Zn-dependent protease